MSVVGLAGYLTLKLLAAITCNLPLAFDVSMEVWFHKSEPLFDATFNIPVSFANITDN